MWESSNWLIAQSQQQRRNVLPSSSIKLGLVLTILNILLWLTALILQAILISNPDLDYYIAPSSNKLLGICLGWSATIFVVTTGSVYLLISNTVKSVKSYLILTASTGCIAFIIFIAFVIILSLDTRPDDLWSGPGGFSIFTGLFVFGESCIIVFYFRSQWKTFRLEVEEERMDRLQQRVREEQLRNLDILNRSSQPAPPIEYQSELVLGSAELLEIEHRKEGDDNDVDSDRFTYYPPVFV